MTPPIAYEIFNTVGAESPDLTGFTEDEAGEYEALQASITSARERQLALRQAAMERVEASDSPLNWHQRRQANDAVKRLSALNVSANAFAELVAQARLKVLTDHLQYWDDAVIGYVQDQLPQ